VHSLSAVVAGRAFAGSALASRPCPRRGSGGEPSLAPLRPGGYTAKNAIEHAGEVGEISSQGEPRQGAPLHDPDRSVGRYHSFRAITQTVEIQVRIPNKENNNVLETCPTCGTPVMFTGDYCPSCRVSKIDGTTQPGFRPRGDASTEPFRPNQTLESTSSRYLSRSPAVVAHDADSELPDMPRDSTSDFNELPVSDTWKAVFSLIQKAGGPPLKNFKTLTFGERMRVGMNFFAFMLGPLYYAAKGMWKKGLLLFLAGNAIIFVVAVICALLKVDVPPQALGAGLSALFGSQANMDFYKKEVLGKSGWWY
jgi:hypothetical protein